MKPKDREPAYHCRHDSDELQLVIPGGAILVNATSTIACSSQFQRSGVKRDAIHGNILLVTRDIPKSPLTSHSMCPNI